MQCNKGVWLLSEAPAFTESPSVETCRVEYLFSETELFTLADSHTSATVYNLFCFFAKPTFHKQ